jgi:hypothetical protein
MTIAKLGDMTIGAALPGVSIGLAAGAAGIGTALPDLQARMTALLAFSPPPLSLGFAGALALAQSVLSQLQAAAALGVPFPSVDTSAAQIAFALAEIGVKLASVSAQLDLIVGLQGALSGGSLRAYAYEGAVGNFGAEFAVELATDPTPAAHAHALVMMTTDPASWSALGALAKVAP